jgi:hypothetical protein
VRNRVCIEESTEQEGKRQDTPIATRIEHGIGRNWSEVLCHFPPSAAHKRSRADNAYVKRSDNTPRLYHQTWAVDISEPFTQPGITLPASPFVCVFVSSQTRSSSESFSSFSCMLRPSASHDLVHVSSISSPFPLNHPFPNPPPPPPPIPTPIPPIAAGGPGACMLTSYS